MASVQTREAEVLDHFKNTLFHSNSSQQLETLPVQPFLAAKSLLQLLDSAFQQRDSGGGACLTLHVCHARLQLLHLKAAWESVSDLTSSDRTSARGLGYLSLQCALVHFQVVSGRALLHQLGAKLVHLRSPAADMRAS